MSGSWRDEASAEAQADLDGLLEEALPFAQDLQAKHGEFFPFAVSMSVDGETVIVAGGADLEQPKSEEVLNILRDGIRRGRDGVRAAAVVSDVSLRESDAVRVELEHREGQALSVYLRYKKRRFRGIEYGELVASESPGHIWS